MSAVSTTTLGETRTRSDASKQAEAAEIKKAFTPYPGLNYYTGDDRDLFAGRSIEIEQCGDLIFQSRVLLLHGPTGCGKSSFLRAGVKPRIARLAKDMHFAGGPNEFDVIRSTDRPLLEFAQRLGAIVKEASKKSGKFTAVNPSADAKAVAQLFDTPEKIDKLSQNGGIAYRAYRSVLELFNEFLILVIDQGEEVFTLNDERRLREEYANKKMSADDIESALMRRREEVSAYFTFLRKVAEEGGSRIIVSLRTEYKGQFDDKIAGKKGHPGTWLKGYYLDVLNETALVEAIRRPVLNEEDWKKLYDAKLVESPTPPSAKAKFQLNFPDTEAKHLASELMKGEAVPPGGVLPALQLACLRIYQQAAESAGHGAAGKREASSKKIDKITVKRSAILRLGAIANQVEEYVSEKIEDACTKDPVTREQIAFDDKVMTPGQLVDLIHRALAKTLVRVEPDGRAVTRRLKGEEFRPMFNEALSGRVKEVEPILESLVLHGVLRDRNIHDDASKEEIWSLGHD